MPAIARVLALVLGLCAVPGYAAGLRLEGMLGLERDGNPARAEAGEGVTPELIATAALRASRSFRIDDRSGWVVHAAGTLRQHERDHALDEAALAAGALYRIQPQVGFTAPWVEASALLERSVRAGSALRDLTRGVLGVASGANLTDRIAMRAGLRLTRADAGSAGVFGQRERALDLEASYRFESSRGYLRGTAARGDQTFGAPQAEDSPAVRAQAPDPVFGPGFQAYRIGAATRALEAGLVVPVTPRQAWWFSVRRLRSRSDAGALYTTDTAGFSWRYLLG